MGGKPTLLRSFLWALVTIINTFAARELTVDKTVVNGAVGPYRFAFACSTNQGESTLAEEDARFQLNDGETRTISVPEGAECVVSESTVAGATVTFEDSDDTDDGRVLKLVKLVSR